MMSSFAQNGSFAKSSENHKPNMFKRIRKAIDEDDMSII